MAGNRAYMMLLQLQPRQLRCAPTALEVILGTWRRLREAMGVVDDGGSEKTAEGRRSLTGRRDGEIWKLGDGVTAQVETEVDCLGSLHARSGTNRHPIVSQRLRLLYDEEWQWAHEISREGQFVQGAISILIHGIQSSVLIGGVTGSSNALYWENISPLE